MSDLAAERVGDAWKPSGLRIHPEIRRRLKIASVNQGVTMEEHLHLLLDEHLPPLPPALPPIRRKPVKHTQ